MIKLSIVTITLNDISTIEQTIKSVINQNYSNLEYIVIDGGSSDGTVEILNKYKNKFKYFKSEPDQGIYDAMNKGIKQATGEYICFVNGGDLLYEDVLSKANDVFSSQSNKLFFSVADVDYIDTHNNVVGTRICASKEKIIKRKFIEMPTNHLGIFVPLEFLKRKGLFNTQLKYRADYLCILQLIKDGYEPLNLNKKAGAFRLGGLSGGYSTFLENYKAIKLVDGNFLIAIYSTILGITKLFFQKNLPKTYNRITKIYYKIVPDNNKKQIFPNNNLKIIHVIDSDSGGGAEKLVMSLIQNSNNNQKVITLKKINEKFYDNENCQSLNIKFTGPLIIFFSIFGIIKILLKIKDKKNIILHSHLSKSLYATFISSLLFGIDHIHTEHNTYNQRRSITSIYFIESLIYNSLKHIICISEPTRFELLFYMPSIKFINTSVIENGTKIYKHLSRDFTKKKLNILILGSLSFKKGIDLFIEILPSLLNKINHVTIVGSGPERQKLIMLTKKLSLDSYVNFIPFVDDPQKYIYESDIGVIPSRWEGFGLVAVEMRSSGLPILISNTPGLHSNFSGYDSVYSFKNGSKESLISSFNLLIDQLKKNKNKVKDLNFDLQKYSQELFVERYNNFYKNIYN